ncbi:MAG: DUF4838 domain-containing protein [Lewinellaceae bacterium]|nr:DUF4838 domain-containing protein [Lewinellaceae bacterium]
MAIKILSGALLPESITGSTTLHFGEHRVTGDAEGAGMTTIGGSGIFLQPPAVHLAVTSFRTRTWWGWVGWFRSLWRPPRESRLPEGEDWLGYRGFSLEKEALSERSVHINWASDWASRIEAIAYKVEGEERPEGFDAAEGDILFAYEGRPMVKLVYTETHLQAAAEDLAEYLNRLTGIDYEILPERPEGPAVIITTPEGAGLEPEVLGEEGFIIRSHPNESNPTFNDLFLAGASELATHFAVTRLLECLGCGWYFPGTLGEVVPPERATLFVRPPCPRTGEVFQPSFRIRGVRELKYDEEMRRWGRRNYQNVVRFGSDGPIPGEYVINRRAHSWGQILRNGDGCEVYHTGEDGKSYLCVTNEDTVTAFVSGIRNLAASPREVDAIVMMPEDSYRSCPCADCESLKDYDGPENRLNSALILQLTNRVAGQIADSHPGLTLIMAAYASYQAPPADPALTPRDNVKVLFAQSSEHNHALTHTDTEDCIFTGINRRVYADYTAWLDRLGDGQRMLLYEYYHQNRWLGLPWSMVHSIKEDLAQFQEDGLAGLWSQFTDNYGTNGLAYYVAARLLWDMEAEPDDLIRDYCYGLFGPTAGEHLYDYYTAMEDAATASGLELPGGGLNNPYWEAMCLFTPGLLDTLEEHLHQASITRGLSSEQYLRVQGMQHTLAYTRALLDWMWEIHDAVVDEATGTMIPPLWEEHSPSAPTHWRELKASSSHRARAICLLETGSPWIHRHGQEGEDINQLLDVPGKAWKAMRPPLCTPRWRGDRDPVPAPESGDLALVVHGYNFFPVHEDGSPVEGIDYQLSLYTPGGDGIFQISLADQERFDRPTADELTFVSTFVLAGIALEAAGPGPWEVKIENTRGAIPARAHQARLYGLWLAPAGSLPAPEHWALFLEREIEDLRSASIAFNELRGSGGLSGGWGGGFGVELVSSVS